ncbi:hypothetical protein [Moorena producens]|uniref:hypothetical protein n=1 Tax=Moorena producens TaxID=1155739 RepID=UPI003C752B61
MVRAHLTGNKRQRKLYLISPINAITINFSTDIVKSYHCSLFPVPCSLFPIPYSLLPTPYSY